MVVGVFVRGALREAIERQVALGRTKAEIARSAMTAYFRLDGTSGPQPGGEGR